MKTIYQNSMGFNKCNNVHKQIYLCKYKIIKEGRSWINNLGFHHKKFEQEEKEK